MKVTQDAASPPSAKVSAAGMVLKFGREGTGLDDLAKRVETLERETAPNGSAKESLAKRPGRNSSSRDEDEDGEGEA